MSVTDRKQLAMEAVKPDNRDIENLSLENNNFTKAV
jgi:hypothetical protein